MCRIFRHYISKNLLILGIAEIFILLISIYLSASLQLLNFQQGITADVQDAQVLITALIFAGVMFGAMTALGLYQRALRTRMQSLLLRLGMSFILGMVLMAGVFHLLPEAFVDNKVLGAALAGAFIGIILCRLCHQYMNGNPRRILVYGVGQKALQIQNMRRKSDRNGVSIIGFVAAGNCPHLVDAANVVTVNTTLVDLARRYGADEIVMALDDQRNSLPDDDIRQYRRLGIDVIDDTTFYERQLGKISIDSLRPSNVFCTDGFSLALTRASSSGKRVFDVVVSGLIFIATLPIMLLTAVSILFVSGGRGTVIYRQVRVGRNGEPFEMYKFRSMCEDAEGDGKAQWAAVNDERVTWVGKFIRATRIDELPQLFNVLLGDMSFVGPRPERSHFVNQLQEIIPYYALRHHVKPGITGWAQICYPYGASVADAREKLQFDLYYLKNYSIFLDLIILFQTVQVILSRKGSR